MENAMQAVVDALNRALEADPNAMHAMLCNRIPCSSHLAADSVLFVTPNPMTGGCTLDAFNLLNTMADAACGMVIQPVFDGGRLLRFEAISTPKQ